VITGTRPHEADDLKQFRSTESARTDDKSRYRRWSIGSFLHATSEEYKTLATKTGPFYGIYNPTNNATNNQRSLS